MPRTQIANRSNFQFGTGSPSLQFAVKHGAEIEAHIEAYGETVTVTGQVSPDGSTWSAMTDAGNGNAMAAVSVNPGGHVNRSFILRPGLDKYLRFNTVGSGVMEMSGAESLDVQKI